MGVVGAMLGLGERDAEYFRCGRPRSRASVVIAGSSQIGVGVTGEDVDVDDSLKIALRRADGEANGDTRRSESR